MGYRMIQRLRHVVTVADDLLNRQRWGRHLYLKVWGFAVAIRLVDIYFIRPICADTTKPTGHCMPFFGDGTAMYGAAQLVRLGKIGYNPIFYTVSGGELVATAAKPPMVVAVLSVASWIGAAPLWLVIAAAVALSAALYRVISARGYRPQALLAVQLVAGVVVTLRIFDGSSIDGARLGGAMYAALAAPIVMAYARKIGGGTCGLTAGLLMALSPAIWTNDTGLNVEVAAVVGIALVLLTSQLVVERWSVPRTTLFGLACALAILSRFELIVIVAITSVWLILRQWRLARSASQANLMTADTPDVANPDGRPGPGETTTETSVWKPVAWGIAAFVVCVGGYGAWNASRIQTSGGGLLTPFGLVLSQAACDQVVYGDLKGLYAPCMVEERTYRATEPIRLDEAIDEVTKVDGYGAMLLSPSNPTRQLFLDRPPTDVYGGRLSVENYRTIYDGMYQREPDGSLGLGVWVDNAVTSDADLELNPGAQVRFKVNLFFLMTDELLTSQVMEQQSMTYLRENASALPSAVLARLGRVAGIYRPSQTIKVNADVEGQGVIGTVGGLIFLWVGLLAFPFVIRKMRRNGVPIVPLLAPFVQVILVCAATYGIIRYRLSVDVVVCVVIAYGLFGRPMTSAQPAIVESVTEEPGRVQS